MASPLVSASQDAWVAVADSLRDALLKYAQVHLLELAPPELIEYLSAVERAYVLNVNACSFDKNVEENQGSPQIQE